ncbi:uncharacterized protein B0H18DRAFT_1117909 [Fomitopsis serialis]|uniref:uncharacterized protein n=1 Tax=Fomitopsis serialis TaxID=139415 RepID=UPI0020080EC3|nr:uncharacterized protein B0H18DRAFT_1117909 [Neoantrodia serialis]KAH9928726.1 hypothetical protein B0H18DRAFT_1117909 [Neoantrodia serialis]
MSQLVDLMLAVGSSPPVSPSSNTVDLPPITGPAAISAGNATASNNDDTSVASESPLTTVSNPSLGDKRRAEEDLVEFAKQVGRRVRLRPAAQKELDANAVLSLSERTLWISARLLKHEEQLETIQPAEDKIEVYSYLVIVSPLLPAYVRHSTPNKCIKTLFDRHTHWGYTTEIRNNTHKNLIVLKRITDRLTDRRAELKSMVWLSLGPEMLSASATAKSRAAAARVDIMTLCESIAAHLAGTRVQVTLELCARVALLRQVLIEVLSIPTFNINQYWDRVDTHLETIRTKYPQATDARMITKVFMAILNADMKEFGSPSLPDARGQDATSAPSQLQALADDAADNFAHDLREE